MTSFLAISAVLLLLVIALKVAPKILFAIAILALFVGLIAEIFTRSPAWH